jgi:hypothetical protein
MSKGEIARREAVKRLSYDAFPAIQNRPYRRFARTEP